MYILATDERYVMEFEMGMHDVSPGEIEAIGDQYNRFEYYEVIAVGPVSRIFQEQLLRIDNIRAFVNEDGWHEDFTPEMLPQERDIVSIRCH